MRAMNSIPTRRSRRLLAVLSTAVLSAFAVPACGGGGDESPTAPPPASTIGTLTVTADQSTCGTTTWSAEVFVNGTSQGRKQLGPFNPIAIPLTAGQYSVSVQLTDGVRTYTSSPVPTTIVANQPTNRIVTCL